MKIKLKIPIHPFTKRAMSLAVLTTLLVVYPAMRAYRVITALGTIPLGAWDEAKTAGNGDSDG